MKRRYSDKIVSAVFFAALTIFSTQTHAGNEDRIGAAGATQLLLNPWARSAGFGNANFATVEGVDAIYGNVSGLAFMNQTQVGFTHTRYLASSDIGINAIGLGQRVGQASVLGVNVVTMNFGEIDRTTVNQPEGGLGTYRPSFGHIALSYAREFSNSIYGGITVKAVTEGLADAKAQGVAFDAGIRYVTGKYNNFKFGISLKNIGPKMKYEGDGLSLTNTLDEKQFTLEQRTEGYELPSVLNLGASYDFLLGNVADSAGTDFVAEHRITGAFNFMSNSFGKDQFSLGVEYGLKEMFMVRVGLAYEQDLFDNEASQNVTTGPTAGFTVALPIGDDGKSVDLDYSYRDTNPFDGIHSIGLTLDL